MTRLFNDNRLQSSSTPEIINGTLALANTEYAVPLPIDCRKFSIRPRNSSNTIKLSYTQGESGTNYMTVDTNFYWEDLIGVSNLTLYLQSPTAGAVVEIVAWN